MLGSTTNDVACLMIHELDSFQGTGKRNRMMREDGHLTMVEFNTRIGPVAKRAHDYWMVTAPPPSPPPRRERKMLFSRPLKTARRASISCCRSWATRAGWTTRTRTSQPSYGKSSTTSSGPTPNLPQPDDVLSL